LPLALPTHSPDSNSVFKAKELKSKVKQKTQHQQLFRIKETPY